MDEKELKTSVKQRVFIILIAVLMLGSVIASYAAIVLNGSKTRTMSTAESEVDQEKVAALQEDYDAKAKAYYGLLASDFEKFSVFRSEVRAFNEVAANNGGVKTRDLVEGSGRELSDGDRDYLAYYIGFCADETIFDSSFDDQDNPTSFVGFLDASVGLIEGWNVGVVGMKLDGIREITIPGELAYGESIEICGGKNKPLKFIIMAKDTKDLTEAKEEMELSELRLEYAKMGYDFDEE